MLLELHGVTGGYADIRILHGITLSVERGTITALVGPNGAGKTTLMRTVAGLLPVADGTLRFAGLDATAQPAAARVNQGIVLVPEGRLVFATFSVEENLRLGAISPRAREGASERLREMYELFPHLRERSRQSAGSLSGGEQQMLAIARGLMSRPDLILLDEPTLGLAPAMVRLVFDTLIRLRESGLTTLLAEQDVKRALEISETAYVIENGRVTGAGRGRELLADPRLQAAYFGM